MPGIGARTRLHAGGARIFPRGQEKARLRIQRHTPLKHQREMNKHGKEQEAQEASHIPKRIL
jgi:hypothetical protein